MKKPLMILIAAALVFSIAASAVFLIVNSNHECATHACRICINIEKAFAIVRGIITVCVLLLLVKILLDEGIAGRFLPEDRTHCLSTPTLLKVKLNN